MEPTLLTEKDATLLRLACIEGHVRAVRRMIQEGRSCPEVLAQTYAIRRALDRCAGLMLRAHLQQLITSPPRPDPESAITRLIAEVFAPPGRHLHRRPGPHRQR